MSTFIKRLLNFGKSNAGTIKKSENKPQVNSIPENIKMNVKGQRVTNDTDGPNINLNTLDRQIYGKEKGPEMLETSIRKKVWFGLFCICLYFLFIYKLIRYRLHADDLDIMEREVNEEMRVKIKVKKLQEEGKKH